MVYSIVSELRSLFRDYGLMIGGGSVSKKYKDKFSTQATRLLVDALKGAEKAISNNFEGVGPQVHAYYLNLKK